MRYSHFFVKKQKKRNKLLYKYKRHKRGKRVKLNDVSVYNIKKMLEIAREEETKKQSAGPKRSYNRLQKRLIKKIEKENKDKAIEISFNNSKLKLEKKVSRKTRSRKAE